MRPLANYTGSFVPFPGDLRSGDKVAPAGCLKVSEGALMLAGLPQTKDALGELVGVSGSLVGQWKGAWRHPAPGYQKAMATRLGIPELAWSRWRPAAGAESGPAADEAPDSGPRPTTSETQAPAPPPPPEPVTLPEAGTPAERARALLTFLSAPGRTPAQLAQAREIRHALALEARALAAGGQKPLHEHPDFEPWVDGLIAALTRVPGALDALDAFLGPAEEQRVAA